MTKSPDELLVLRFGVKSVMHFGAGRERKNRSTPMPGSTPPASNSPATRWQKVLPRLPVLYDRGGVSVVV